MNRPNLAVVEVRDAYLIWMGIINNKSNHGSGGDVKNIGVEMQHEIAANVGYVALFSLSSHHLCLPQ